MSYSFGQAAYKLAFEISPITLTGGIAGGMSGGALPLPALLSGGGPLGGGDGLDSSFANFYPIPGSTLITNMVGEYPFANQAIAANAVIKMPLMVSLLMRCPVNAGTYWQKLGIMTGLQNTLANHCAQGGLFTVATPSFYYTGCILVDLQDVSGGETNQAQMAYRWDFRRPLVALEGNGGSPNSFTGLLGSGAFVPDNTIGRVLQNPQTAGSPAILPTSQAAFSAGVPSP